MSKVFEVDEIKKHNTGECAAADQLQEDECLEAPVIWRASSRARRALGALECSASCRRSACQSCWIRAERAIALVKRRAACDSGVADRQTPAL